MRPIDQVGAALWSSHLPVLGRGGSTTLPESRRGVHVVVLCLHFTAGLVLLCTRTRSRIDAVSTKTWASALNYAHAHARITRHTHHA